MVETLYAFHRPVGSSDLETSSRTLPVVTSVIEANHRPLAVSKWIFGSLMKSVDGTPKNESSGNVCTSPPCFVEIRPRTFTISTTWFGPTATWTSGGVRRFVYGPFVPKWRPSKETTGTAVSGIGVGGRAGVGRTNWLLIGTRGSVFPLSGALDSSSNTCRRGLVSLNRDKVTNPIRDGATVRPKTQSATTRRHS